jgi:hypothetical protein
MAVATFVGATDGFAANLLVNSDFDQTASMAGWTWIQVVDGGESVACGTGATCGAMHFSTAECCGVGASGSVASNSSFFDAEALAQCVTGIVENTAYDFGAWIRLTTVPGMQPGLPGVLVRWYSSNDCSGSALAFNGTSVGPVSWSRTAFPMNIAPSGSHSAQFLLRAAPTGDSGTSVGMEFDSAFFGPSGTVPVELQSFAID